MATSKGEISLIRTSTVGPPPVPPLIDPNDLSKEGLLKLSEDPKRMEEQLKEIKKLCEECKKRGEGIKIMRYYERDKETPRKKMITESKEGKHLHEKTLAKKLKLNFSVIIDAQGDARILYEGKGKLLGEGAFGRVKFQQNIQTKKFDVVKISKLSKGSTVAKLADQRKAMTASDAAEEIRLSKKAKLHQGEFTRKGITGHPERQYLFQHYGGQHDLLFITAADPNIDRFKLIYKGKVRKNKEFIGTFEERLEIALKVFQKMRVMHKEQGILHRDVKSLNILYDQATKEVFIIDYGFSTDMPKDGKILTRQFCGTLEYCAPEIRDKIQDIEVLHKPNVFFEYSEATDVYAAGVVLMDLFGYNVGINPTPGPYYGKPSQASKFEHNGVWYDVWIWKDAKIAEMLKDENPDIALARKEAMNKIENLIKMITAEKLNRDIKTDDDALREILKIKDEMELKIKKAQEKVKAEKKSIEVKVEVDKESKEAEDEFEKDKKEIEAIHRVFIIELEKNRTALNIKQSDPEFINFQKWTISPFFLDIPLEDILTLIQRNLQSLTKMYVKPLEGVFGQHALKQLCERMMPLTDIDKIKIRLKEESKEKQKPSTPKKIS